MRSRSGASIESHERATKQRIELKLNEAQRALREAHKLSNEVSGMIGGDSLNLGLASIMTSVEKEKLRVRALGSTFAIG